MDQTENKVTGLKNIANALKVSGTEKAALKRTYRILRVFDITFEKNGRHITVYQRDIDAYNNLIVGKKAIAEFLQIHRTTLERWLKKNKRFRHMLKGEKTLYINKDKLCKWNDGRKLKMVGLNPYLRIYTQPSIKQLQP
jgi:hypothetical protein